MLRTIECGVPTLLLGRSFIPKHQTASSFLKKILKTVFILLTEDVKIQENVHDPHWFSVKCFFLVVVLQESWRLEIIIPKDV